MGRLEIISGLSCRRRRRTFNVRDDFQCDLCLFVLQWPWHRSRAHGAPSANHGSMEPMGPYGTPHAPMTSWVCVHSKSYLHLSRSWEWLAWVLCLTASCVLLLLSSHSPSPSASLSPSSSLVPALAPLAPAPPDSFSSCHLG